MKKIFLNGSNLEKGATIDIEDDDCHHLVRVLRVKKGEEFIIGDYSDNEFKGRIVSINKKKVSFLLEESYHREKEAIPDISLFFCLLKGDKNELIIRKCSEIGVNNFIPLISKNCVAGFDKKKDKKIARWKSIAKEASMQSGRKNIPKIFDIILFDQLNKYDINEIKIFGHIKGKKRNIKDIIKDNPESKSFSLLVGPEGDFVEKEINQLNEWEWKGIKLSQNIFTSETAAIFLVSAVFSNY